MLAARHGRTARAYSNLLMKMYESLSHHTHAFLSSSGVVFLLALVAAVLVRLPYVPSAVIDWDESTFALMGDSLVRGHLPYVELTDNKPPLIFVLFAGIQFLAGKSIVAIRIAAMLLVALAAWLSARAALRGAGAGAWAALGVLPVAVLSTIHPGTGSLLTEHLAIVFLAVAVLLLSSPALTPASGFVLALIAAVAVLTRTNLAYPALALGAAALVLPLAPGVRRLPFLAAFGGGALLPVAILLAVYRHHLGDLYAATITGPLAYSGGAGLLTPSWWREAETLAKGFATATMLPLTLGAAVGAIAGLRDASTRRFALVLLAGTIAVGAGVAASGRIFPHYLIQFLPFLAPLFALGARAIARLHPPTIFLAVVLAALAWGPPLGRNYLHHARRLAAGEPLWADPASQLVRYLESHGATGQTMFLAKGHIAYWLLDSIPPTRIAHPTNFGHAGMMREVLGPDWTAEAELDAIFRREPRFVVLPEDGTALGLSREASDRLRSRVESGYALDEKVGDLLVYRR